MTQDTASMTSRTIGLDLSDRMSTWCVLDESGEVVERGQVGTTPRAVGKLFGGWAPCRVALEVGTHSPWVQRLLERCGHEVIVANARKLRMIYQNESKSDQLDAEMLARVARLDSRLLHPLRHGGLQAQADRGVLRARNVLVQTRTRQINHVRGALKSFGLRVPGGSIPTFHRRAREVLPRLLEPALGPVLRLIETLTVQIQGYDRQLESMALKRYPETERLRQVTGVGVLTALCFVLTIEDPQRFRCSRTVGAYVGLRPRRAQSGTRDPELHVTKAGSPELRRHLVQAAHYILGPFGPDTDLRRWGLELQARGKKAARKRAITAVARKLAVLLHRLWVSGQDYDPLRGTRAREHRESRQRRQRRVVPVAG